MFIKSLLIVVSVAFVAGVVGVNAEESVTGKAAESNIAPATCTPKETYIIGSTGVLTIVPYTCTGNSVTKTVSALDGPWDQTINTSMVYATAGEDPLPLKITLSTYGIVPGSFIALECISGTSNGGGLPNSGCAGLNDDGYGPTNNVFQPACGTYYPSAYVDPTNYPIYLMQVIGAFATSAGVVVGLPFPLSPQVEFVSVPAGAEVLQLGFDDCLFSDNSGSLRVRMWY